MDNVENLIAILNAAKQQNEPAMSLKNGGVGNVNGDILPEQAINSASKVINKYWDKHAEDIAAQPGGIDVLHKLVETHNTMNENPNFIPAKNITSPAQITPEGNIQEGGALSWVGGNNTGMLLKKMLLASQINENLNKNKGFNTEEAISKMAKLNKTIDEQLPGYQVTQTADGNMVIHPKAAGILAQMAPEQIDALSDSLVNNQITPSQLPRVQKAQVIAAALAKDPNYSPAQADMEFAANKMGATSFERNYNNLDSFHRDFEKNADYLLKLSSNFDRSKLPIINRAIVGGGRSITGDPKATQLLQAVNTVANGYARLQNPTLAGQALSDAARKEAQDIISGFGSDEQLRSLLDPKNGSMRIDAQNRIDAAQEIRNRIKNTYGKSVKNTTANSGYENYLKTIGK